MMHKPIPSPAMLTASSLAAAQAADQLKSGIVLIVPTDTVYGLAACADDPDALNQLAILKQRPAGKPFPVHVATLQAAQKFITLETKWWTWLEAQWPDALTVIAPIHPKHNLGPGAFDPIHGTVALRIPAHEAWRRVLQDINRPIAVPSANPAGHEPPVTLAAARYYFPDLPFLAEGTAPCGTPSTLLNLTVTPPQVERGQLSPSSWISVLDLI